jgi:hypothetical protein
MVIATWFPAELDKNAEQEAVTRHPRVRNFPASNFVSCPLECGECSNLLKTGLHRYDRIALWPRMATSLRTLSTTALPTKSATQACVTFRAIGIMAVEIEPTDNSRRKKR